MAANNTQNTFLKFLNSEKCKPIIAAIAAGLYPLLFYFTNNYTSINSWGHLGYFVSVFLLAPIAVFFVVSRINIFKKLQPFVLPFLNISFFLFFLSVAIYAGFSWWRSLIILLVAFLAALFLWKFFKKWIVFQLILAVIGVITLAPVVISQLNYSKEWLKQPDNIEQAVFKTKPNVYFIQPDGYANFSELKEKNYNIDNTDFENFLRENNFKSYDGFRSNYAATLPSNSSIFMMKHHYYNNGSDFTEAIDAREVIVSDNSVLKIFKRNGYKTFFLSEQPYFLVNRPKLGYDYSNFSSKEISFVTTGLDIQKDVLPSLKMFIEEHPAGPNFFFVEIFNPGHITNQTYDSKGIAGERAHYGESLQEANVKLKKITQTILKNDPEALIIFMADHGGFVGMEYTGETYTKNLDRDFVNSIFTSILAIHWPNGLAPSYENEFSTSVNMFRILTSYLSDDTSYLQHLQEDGSYIIINKGAPKGVYEYLDDQGKVVFKKK